MQLRLLLNTAAATDNGPARRTFTIRDLVPARISAAGLATGESIAIYMRVGASTTSKTSQAVNNTEGDYLWEPVSRDGVPLVLTSESNDYIEKIPGVYMIGPVSGVTGLSGDVNVSIDFLHEKYLYVQVGSAQPAPCPPVVPAGVLGSW